MFNFLCVVDSYFQIDTSAEDEGEGWRAEKPFLTHHNHPPRRYYWPSQGDTFVAVTFILCSVLVIY